MSDEFITKGFKNDRYLKSIRLTEKFESEIENLISEHFFEELSNENNKIFDDQEPQTRIHRNPSSCAGLIRLQRDLVKGESLKLNCGLEWGKRPESDDEVISYVYYKIKNLSDEKFDELKTNISNSLKTGEDKWGNAPGIIYNPLKDQNDIQNSLEELRQHFNKYAKEVL